MPYPYDNDNPYAWTNQYMGEYGANFAPAMGAVNSMLGSLYSQFNPFGSYNTPTWSMNSNLGSLGGFARSLYPDLPQMQLPGYRGFDLPLPPSYSSGLGGYGGLGGMGGGGYSGGFGGLDGGLYSNNGYGGLFGGEFIGTPGTYLQGSNPWSSPSGMGYMGNYSPFGLGASMDLPMPMGWGTGTGGLTGGSSFLGGLGGLGSSYSPGSSYSFGANAGSLFSPMNTGLGSFGGFSSPYSTASSNPFNTLGGLYSGWGGLGGSTYGSTDPGFSLPGLGGLGAYGSSSLFGSGGGGDPAFGDPLSGAYAEGGMRQPRETFNQYEWPGIDGFSLPELPNRQDLTFNGGYNTTDLTKMPQHQQFPQVQPLPQVMPQEPQVQPLAQIQPAQPLPTAQPAPVPQAGTTPAQPATAQQPRTWTSPDNGGFLPEGWAAGVRVLTPTPWNPGLPDATPQPAAQPIDFSTQPSAREPAHGLFPGATPPKTPQADGVGTQHQNASNTMQYWSQQNPVAPSGTGMQKPWNPTTAPAPPAPPPPVSPFGSMAQSPYDPPPAPPPPQPPATWEQRTAVPRGSESIRAGHMVPVGYDPSQFPAAQPGASEGSQVGQATGMPSNAATASLTSTPPPPPPPAPQRPAPQTQFSYRQPSQPPAASQAPTTSQSFFQRRPALPQFPQRQGGVPMQPPQAPTGGLFTVMGRRQGPTPTGSQPFRSLPKFPPVPGQQPTQQQPANQQTTVSPDGTVENNTLSEAMPKPWWMKQAKTPQPANAAYSANTY